MRENKTYTLREIIQEAKIERMLIRVQFQHGYTWASRNSVYGWPWETVIANFADFHRDMRWNVETVGKVLVCTNNNL